VTDGFSRRSLGGGERCGCCSAKPRNAWGGDFCGRGANRLYKNRRLVWGAYTTCSSRFYRATCGCRSKTGEEAGAAAAAGGVGHRAGRVNVRGKRSARPILASTSPLSTPQGQKMSAIMVICGWDGMQRGGTRPVNRRGRRRSFSEGRRGRARCWGGR